MNSSMQMKIADVDEIDFLITELRGQSGVASLQSKI